MSDPRAVATTVASAVIDLLEQDVIEHRTAQLARWFACLSLLLMIRPASALPGDLDLTYGGGTGAVFAAPVAVYDTLSATVRRSDGRFLVGGYCNSASLSRAFCLSSRNADGSPDASFNGTGSALTQVATGFTSDTALALALQADGKALLAGWCDSSSRDFCVVRYNTNGTLDTTFGDAGKRLLDFGNSNNSDTLTALVVQGDGRIVLIGFCNGQSTFCIARLTGNGQLDSTWGGTGLVATDIVANDLDLAQAGTLLPDGRLVIAGFCRTTPGSPFTAYDFCLTRYLANGTLDTTFGTAGIVITPVGTEWDQPHTLKRLSDGRLLAAGQCRVPDDAGTGLKDSFCAVRYQANGALDTTFGIGGKVTISPAPEFRYGGIDVYADGRILVAGACRHLNATSGCNATFGAGKFLLMRLTAAGALDISFAAGGINYFALGRYSNYAYPANVTLLPDGKVLFTASCAVGAVGDPNPNGAVFCFARFEGEPSPPVLCTLDLDGDGQVLATTDALLHLRIALGVPDTAKTTGITFPASATRNNWSAIDTYLRSLCAPASPYCTLDIDGDGLNTALTDAAIHLRIAAGLRDSRVVAGLNFPANAPRRTWTDVRQYLATQCGVTGLQD